MDFYFRIYDVSSSFEYKIPYHKLHLSGNIFNDVAEHCYLPVFQHGLKKSDLVDYDQLVLMGNIFMQDYYVVYDMSPLDEDKKYI